MFENSRKSLTIFCCDFRFRAVQKCDNLVDLGKCCKMSIYLQNFMPIQPRTSLLKFGHLAAKSGKSTVLYLSTKISRPTVGVVVGKAPSGREPRNPSEQLCGFGNTRRRLRASLFRRKWKRNQETGAELLQVSQSLSAGGRGRGRSVKIKSQGWMKIKEN